MKSIALPNTKFHSSCKFEARDLHRSILLPNAPLENWSTNLSKEKSARTGERSKIRVHLHRNETQKKSHVVLLSAQLPNPCTMHKLQRGEGSCHCRLESWPLGIENSYKFMTTISLIPT